MIETTLVIPDQHIPYHDVRNVNLLLKVVRTVMPHRLVILGDWADCYAVSRFSKHPTRRADLKWELDQASELLRDFVQAADCEVIFCEGNHEKRIETYLCDRAPELYGLVSSKDLLLRGTRYVQWVPYREHVRCGKVLYMHDCGHAGVYAVRHTLAATGANVVFGHTHRAGLHVDGDHTGDRRFALNCGWGGDLSAVDYMHKIKTKDWITGFGLVDEDTATRLVWPTFVPTLNGRCVVHGKEIVL